MDSKLMMALHEQYLLYVAEMAKTAKNLATFLNQNQDFCAAFDVSVLLYIKSADFKLSLEHKKICSSPDLQILTGDITNLRDMCAELAQAVSA